MSRACVPEKGSAVVIGMAWSYQPREVKELSSKVSWKSTTPPPEPPVTVTTAAPLWPSLVAVMVAVPPATAVTSPPVDTSATPQVPDAQATARPVSTLPAASLSVAVSCTVCPTAMFAAAGLTLTDATGTRLTVTAALPAFPSLVAVIVADPAAAPVTSPLADTVATAQALDVQATARPVSTLPAASLSVAVSCAAPPSRMTAVTGPITTDATGTFATLVAADPLCPSLVAVIVTDPAATPVTSPAADTVAIAGFERVQVTARPVRMFPAASLAVAVSCTECPTRTPVAAGLTLTDATATGTSSTVTAALPVCP